MTAADRDPLTIAREVLETAHEDETVTVCSVPDNKVAALARAVIDLTAKLDAERFAHANTAVKVKGVEALADRLSAEAADDFDGVSGTSVSLVKYETAKAIRTALNGENR